MMPLPKTVAKQRHGSKIIDVVDDGRPPILTEVNGMTDLERRTLPTTRVEIRAGTRGARKLIGRAVPYGVLSSDLGGFREIWKAGAFDDVLKDSDVRSFFNHNPDHLLGRESAGTLHLKDGPAGLDYVIDPLPDTTVAQDVVENVRLGNIQGNSFSFAVAEGGDAWDRDETGMAIRTVHKASALWEIGPVTSPAFPEGTTISTRSLALAERLTNAPNCAAGSDDLARETRLIRAKQNALEVKWGVFPYDDGFDDY